MDTDLREPDVDQSFHMPVLTPHCNKQKIDSSSSIECDRFDLV